MLPALVLVAGLADTAATLPHARATRTASAPSIDGRLDDAVWEKASVERAFTQKFPVERAPPSEETTFRILYDDDAVYVGIDCRQVSVPIVHRLTRRDRVVEADRVTISFDSRGTGTSAFELGVNAAGVLTDAIRFNDTELDADWDETWDARVADTDHGWSAEIRVPLRILRFSDLANQSWGLQVRRYISVLQETDEWSFIPRAGAGEVSRYGRLDGVEQLRPRPTIELRPFVLGRVDRRDPGTETVGSGTSLSASAGLDLKWHLRQDLTLDATLNPDFAQVEADRLILNLTNEEIELPEKRPFFLEGRDVFATPLPLLYTRRIGRVAPVVPALRDGESLVDPTTPASLIGAQKLSGHLGERFSVGALSALTARNDALVEDANGARAKQPVEALALFNALRLKRDIGENGHVGLMATAVTRAEDTLRYPREPAGVLCPTGAVVQAGRRCFHDAYVGAADGRWRSPGGDYAASAQLVGSAMREGPTRTLRDGTKIGSGDLGYGGTARIAKEGGVPWVADLEYTGASRRLDFNDAGYMPRQDLHSLEGNLEYRTLEPWFETIETHSRLELFGRRNLDGLVLAQGYQINTKWKLPSFWEIFTEVHYRARHYDDREVGDGTALERAALVGFELEVTSDPRRRVAFEAATQTQRIFDGWAFNGSATVTFRVLPQLDIALTPEGQYAFGEPRFATRVSDALVFGKLEAGELSTTLRATYTFVPRLTLQGYAQLFLAAGHYTDLSAVVGPSGRGTVVNRSDLILSAVPPTNPDFVDAALATNVVLRWEYALGSTIFLVYTRTQAPRIELIPGQRGTIDASGVGRAPATDTILLKISHFFG